MPNELVPVLTKRELAQSQLYPNIKTSSQAAVVMAKAQSYGLSPTTIADGLYFVGGKPALSAQLIATLVKRSDKYDFRVKEKTDKQCSIEFFDLSDGKRESLGVETFTLAMATRAGLASGVNWKKFPEAMLWARCLTAGVRARCPDALGGGPVYCVEELRPETEVDSEGRPIIDAEVIEERPNALPSVESLIAQTNTDVTRVLAHYKVESLRNLSSSQREELVANLQAKAAAQGV